MSLVTREDLLFLNKELVLEGGGVGHGEMSGKSVTALISRVENAIHYGQIDESNHLEVACYWAEVISRGHVFMDGNKRTSLAIMLAYLNAYGINIRVSEEALAEFIVDLAQGKIDHRDLMAKVRIKN